jgi:hypothetical protein
MLVRLSQGFPWESALANIKPKAFIGWHCAGFRRIWRHHLAAKLYLERHPTHYEVVRRFLGHNSIRTTASFYTGLQTHAAVAHFDETIGRLRAASGPCGQRILSSCFAACPRGGHYDGHLHAPPRDHASA